MESYDTLVEAMQSLRKQGYTSDFNLEPDCLTCGSELSLYPQDFEVDKFFRFEGDSNPDDESILYAVSSKDGSVKGILVSSYGVYTEEYEAELIKKLS